MGFSDYDKYDGIGLAKLVYDRQVKPEELVEEAIDRIERLNPRLNAVVHKMYELARQTAVQELPDGPFKGVPSLLKDLLTAHAGVPLTSGSRFFRDLIPSHDSSLVKRFRDAGIIFVGKTNTPEFGLMPITEPELFGPCRNPWNLALTPGGSSGGSAAAVAARIVPFAHGSDGGGSIRIPASCCGVFGLKPTRGRNPIGPDFGEFWRGLFCEHVITRSVRDSAAMLDSISGPDTGALYYAVPPSSPFLSEVGREPDKLRIAFSSKPFYGGPVAQDCVTALEFAAQVCQNLGHDVVEATPQIDGNSFARAFLMIVSVETRATIQEGEMLLRRKATSEDFEPGTWEIGLLGRQCRAPDFARFLNALQLTARRIGGFFEDYDVLLTPTLARPPIPIGSLHPDEAQHPAMTEFQDKIYSGSPIDTLDGVEVLSQHIYEFMPYTQPFNVTGQPAMSVPLYWSDEGLPIGVQFVGRYGDEATLLRLAGQLEAAQPWSDRVPRICKGAD